MKKFIVVFLFLLLAVSSSLIVSSCGKSADPEIMAADSAISAAVTAGAAEFTPQMLEEARSLLAEARALNDQRKFDDARKKAEAVIVSAGNAQKEAERLKSIPPAPTDTTLVADTTAAAVTTTVTTPSK